MGLGGTRTYKNDINIGKHKFWYSNQYELFDAISEIRDIEYHIAGYLVEDLLESLKKIDPHNKLKYYGKVTKPELKKFYDNAMIGYVVYDYKLNLGYNLGSFGTNKIFEYMEAGLPIICTDFILWKEIIEKYDCGICVEPNNSSQIKKAIEFLLNNKEKAYIMGRNGQKAIESEYNWNEEEKKYLAIFRKYNQ